MRSIIFAVVVLFSTNVQARQQYKSDIPANRTVFGECNVCHADIAVNRARNEFGQRAQSFSDGSSVSWTGSVYRGLQLFEHDTDGDGYTNGYELGDPNGTWDASQPFPAADITYNPSDPNDNPCGNGTIEGPEDCEGDSVDGNTCASEGYEPGTLTCNGCFFDYTACGPKVGGTNNGTNSNTNNSTGSNTNNTNNTTNNTNNATANNSNSNTTSNPTTPNTGNTTGQTTTTTNNNGTTGLNDINGTSSCSSTTSSNSWTAFLILALLFARKRRKK